MIAVRPGSFAWEVLRQVAEYPGELSVDDLVARLKLLPRRVQPFKSAEERRAWLEMMDDSRRASCARVTRTLGRLVEARLVEPMRPPRLSPEFAKRAAQDGLSAALLAFHPAWPAPPKADLSGYLALVAEVENLPPSARDLLGAKPSGARQACYADLVRWGVVVAPQQRWPTAAGVALICGDARRCA